MLLAGDIGGTKTVLAIYEPDEGPHQPVTEETFASRAYESLEAVIWDFLQDKQQTVSHASLGVAGPVIDEKAEITNLPWVIDRERLRATFSLSGVVLLNDLQAVAAAVPVLREQDIKTLSSGRPDPKGAIGVIAPGTGLGEAFLVSESDRYHAYPSEGGHVDFAPVGELQIDLLRYLAPRLNHVSYEWVCSGLGIPNLYAFLRDTGRYEEPSWLEQELSGAQDATPLIVRAAQEEQAAICVATLNLFVEILAQEAANLALKQMATGGIFLGGGIPPRILSQLQQGRFLEAFVDKGRFRDLLSRIPVHVILNSQAALIGAAYHGLSMMT